MTIVVLFNNKNYHYGCHIRNSTIICECILCDNFHEIKVKTYLTLGIL